MESTTPLFAAGGLFILALLAGLIWKATNGRGRKVMKTSRVDLVKLAATKGNKNVLAFGKKATMLQFSTEFCRFCPPTARFLGELEGKHSGLLHVEVDLTDRIDLASHFNVLQTPTILLLDSKGFVRSRINGPPKPGVVLQELERMGIR